MAVTVDDLPATPATDLAEMRRITKGVLAALKKHRAPAVGFVNEGKLAPEPERKQRVALLRQWLEAGHDLGNHTYSHADLQTTPLAAYEREVMRGEEETRRLQAERGRGVALLPPPLHAHGAERRGPRGVRGVPGLARLLGRAVQHRGFGLRLRRGSGAARRRRATAAPRSA